MGCKSGPSKHPRLWLSQDLLLAEPVDAVITSPPYPGVYNYMAAAASAASALGFRPGKGAEFAHPKH